MNHTRKTPQEKLWNRTRRNPETGCLDWIGPLNSNGYGGVSWRPLGIVGVHVAAWIETFGLVPKGLHVLHSCDNRHCCEPKHLFLGTRSDNMRDCVAKGRAGLKSFWDTASEAEKQAKKEQMRCIGKRPKSAETRQRMSEARKRWWAERA